MSVSSHYYKLILLLIFCAGTLHAQENINLQVVANAKEANLLQKYKYNEKPRDSIGAANTIKALVKQLHADGYLLAAEDSVNRNQNSYISYLSIGPRFEWLYLKPGNIENSLLRKITYRKKGFEGRRFNYQELARIENRLLSYMENNGFTFAAVTYDSLTITGNAIGASMNLDTGPAITFDSVYVQGEPVVKSKFIGAYLGIALGDAYDESRLDDMVRRIQNLPYLRLAEAPMVTFQNEEASIKLQFEKRPINTIDGIIGFLPQSSRESGLLVTGQFDMDLFNPFGSGKHIGVHWRRVSEETQTLGLQYEHPNLLRSQLSFAGDFNFLKQDTSFTKRDLRTDLYINLGANKKLGAFTSFIGTDLLSTEQYKEATALPDIIDFRLTMYGLNFNFENLDDPVLPRSGNALSISAAAGNKRIRQNTNIPAELYEDIDLNTIQYQIDFKFDQFLRVKQNWAVYTALTGGFMESENLFKNDAYRLGGLKSIRGFNENYFFATKYIQATVENRIFFEQDSYLSTFADFGTLKGFAEGSGRDAFLGIGAGFTLATSRGLFNFVYALGSSDSVGSFDFNQSKIHFGYTTRF